MVAVKHTLGDAPHDFGLGLTERGLGRLLVTAGDRRLDQFDTGPDTARAVTVHLGAPLDLPDTLLCRFMLGHVNPFVSALLHEYRCLR